MRAAFLFLSALFSKMELEIRPSGARGTADHGWLKTSHTFSFADYFDRKYSGFGPLQVINEDHVKPGKGFGTHGHSDFEIFSYVVRGELEHKDSMGNTETIRRGEVQFTSAGKGIRHSEYNRNPKDWVHFIQVWVQPDANGLKPSYTTRKFDDKEKEGRLCHIISPAADSPKDGSTISINQDFNMYASILKAGATTPTHIAKGRQAYVHVIEGKNVTLGVSTGDGKSVSLRGGDGVFVKNGGGELVFTGVGNEPAEFLLFEMEA